MYNFGTNGLTIHFQQAGGQQWPCSLTMQSTLPVCPRVGKPQLKARERMDSSDNNVQLYSHTHHKYTLTHTHIFTHTHTFTHTSSLTQSWRTHTHKNTHKHTHTHTHTHTQTIETTFTHNQLVSYWHIVCECLCLCEGVLCVYSVCFVCVCVCVCLLRQESIKPRAIVDNYHNTQ